jgi:hypothetical protein
VFSLPEKLNESIVEKTNEGYVVAHFTILDKLAKSEHEVKYTCTLVQIQLAYVYLK